MSKKTSNRNISWVIALVMGCFLCATDAWSDKLASSGDAAGEPISGGVSGGSDPHANLIFKNYPSNCLGCHQTQAAEVAGSTHYKWTGDAPDMVNGVGLQQGKLTNAVNSYCINILGN